MQTKVVTDIQQDILKLSYPPNSIEEIRLHHVFEHFTRPIACALIAIWRYWLIPGGILRIEVPDAGKMAWTLWNPFASHKCQALAERHMFGSHEAHWAVHCVGYTLRSLKKLLLAYEFSINNINKISWRGTHNIEIIAKKNGYVLTKDEAGKRARQILVNSLVDDSASELRLLDEWLRIYNQQLETGWTTE